MASGTRVVWDPSFTSYDFGPGHPLTPVRLDLTARLARGLGTDDDPVFAGMHEASARVATGSVECAEQVWRGEVAHGVNFCGGLHHAMPDRASGFCVYNDIAPVSYTHLRAHET